MKFATDKILHGYLGTYLRIAAELGPAARVVEVGVQEGHGLDLFQALFPSGLVCGVDVDGRSRWPDGTVRVVAAQDDPGLPARLGDAGRTWDLVVDDASHSGEATAATFALLWPLVSPGGYYVIEDWMVGLPGEWPVYGSSMLAMAQGLLLLLTRGGDVEDITYRYGLAVLRKRR